MSMYLGDYNEDDTLYFTWDTSAIAGGSITRSTDGTISVYKDNGVTQSVAGVTDTEDFDALTGVHACTIVLTDGFYVTGADYSVVLSASTIDGKTVNATLAAFSIENRFMRGTEAAALASALATAQADLDIITGATGVNLLTATQASIDAIEVDTNELQSDDVPGLIAALDTVVDRVEADTQSIETKVDLIDTFVDTEIAAMKTVVDDILVDTDTTIPALVAALNNLSAADINAQVDLALADIHLDHLFAADYDPSSPPGSVTSLMNELVENDGGVARFTTNALEQGPSGGGSTDLAGIRLKDTTIAVVNSQVEPVSFTLTDGSTDDDAYNDLTLVIVDQSDSDQVAVHRVSDYVGSTKTVTIEGTPVFLIAPGELIYVMSAKYGNELSGTEIAQAVLNATATSYDVSGSIGELINYASEIVADTTVLADTRIPDVLSLANINTQSDTSLTDFFTSAGRLVDDIWSEDLSTYVTADTAGKLAYDTESDTSTLVDTRIPDTISLTAINAQVDTALADIHLDHLLAVDYDPASQPGVATALLNELIEDDGGVSRFTTNSLEQGPTGSGTVNANIIEILGTAVTEGSSGRAAGNWSTFNNNGNVATASTLDDVGGGASVNSLLMIDTTVAAVNSTTSFDLTAGSPDDDAYNDMLVMFIDQSDNTQRSVRRIGDYVESGNTISTTAEAEFIVVAGDIVRIYAVANHISLVDTCTTNTDMISASTVNAEVDTALADIGLDHLVGAVVTGTDITDNSIIAKMVSSNPTADWDDFDNTSNSLSALPSQAEITTLVQAVIETNHLDHLLAVDYNPAAPPGVMSALLNELVEDDGGTSRFNANALELGPSGSGALAPITMLDTSITTVTSQTEFILTAGSVDDNAYNGRLVVFTDGTTPTRKSARRVVDYDGTTTMITIESNPDFLIDTEDSVLILTLTGLDGAGVAAELATYDGPTKIEMDDAIAGVGAGPLVLVDTTIATLSSQTEFTLTAGSADDNAYNGMLVIVTNSSTAVQQCVGIVTDYVGSISLAVTLRLNPGVFTMAEGDRVEILAVPAPEAGAGGITALEMDQVRHRLGIDGTQTAPATNVPSLAMDADLTTALNRIGAWTGTGDNTVLGGIKAALSTSASLPSDIGGSMDPGTDSLQAIRDRGDAAWTTGVGGDSEWDAADVRQVRYMLNLDGTQATPVVSQSPRLEVNATEIEGQDATDQINQACDTALTDYAGAKPADITASESVITAAIVALNNTSTGDILTQASAALVAYDPPTHAELTDDTDALSSTLSGLNDIAASDVLAQVTAGLGTYDSPTRLELTDDIGTVTTAISNQNDIAASDVLTQASAALTVYDPPNNTELAAVQSAIQIDIAALDAVVDTLDGVTSAVVLAQCSAAIAAYDPPTKAGLASAHSTTDALINGLDDVTAAQVNAQVAAALATYDAATGTDVSGLNNLAASDVLAQVTAGLGTYDPPTRLELTDDIGTVTTAISALNDLSAVQVNAEVDTALGDYDGPKKVEMDSALASTVAGLNDISATDVLTQATLALNTYDPPKHTELLSDTVSIIAAIDALDNLGAGDIPAQVIAALTTYDAVTQADLDAAETTIVAAVPESGGTVSLSVTSPVQVGNTVNLKRGNPATLVFTVVDLITMSDVLLGISDDAGRSILKLEGVIDSTTQCTFEISMSDALRLREGSFNLDVFEVEGYNAQNGAYTDANSIVTGPVEIAALYLRLENS